MRFAYVDCIALPPYVLIGETFRQKILIHKLFHCQLWAGVRCRLREKLMVILLHIAIDALVDGLQMLGRLRLVEVAKSPLSELGYCHGQEREDKDGSKRFKQCEARGRMMGFHWILTILTTEPEGMEAGTETVPGYSTPFLFSPTSRELPRAFRIEAPSSPSALP